MNPFRLAVLWTLILSSPVLAGPGGPRPEPINEALQCRQMDSAVVLEWNIQFLTVSLQRPAEGKVCQPAARS
ncbi:MAG TPA: hypothetical protein VMT52_17975 [Planctomycetota bacterium]|nr:hypothetical protein [Planctomycetota bacterium]